MSAISLAVLFDAGTGQLGLFSLFSPTGPTLSVSSPICGIWDLKPAPFSGFLSEVEVSGITTSPSGSVWVVGDATNFISEGYHPAMSHWEGNRWLTIGLPDFRSEKAYLDDAYFISENDGWAVGHALVPGPGVIAMHWNGWTWSLTDTPPVSGALSRVSAFAGDDVWAVGWQNSESPVEHNPLVMHWDGNKWDTVNLPEPKAKATLYDVLPLAAGNVWAVGGYDDRLSPEPLILHWDGRNWNTVPSPKLCSGNHTLISISALDSNDIWAVGSCDDGNTTLTRKLAEHWDGTSWSISEVAKPHEERGSLSGVVVLSSTDVWAAGTHPYDGITAFVQHWDGSQWLNIDGPPVSWSPQVGWDFVSVSSDEFWLLGYGYNSEHPLLARFVRCH
jgi:hypothetical protein